MSKKVLIITHHRKNRSPGQRFRFEQYINFLASHEIEFDWDILLTEQEDKIFYSRSTLLKLWLIIKLFIKRLKTIKKVANYDAIFIYREAFVLRDIFFERRIAKRNPNIIFDFDDAIWLQNVSKQNEKFKWLKNPNKTKEIIQLAKVVITGNNFLNEFAKQFNDFAYVIPTTIDTNYHIPSKKNSVDNIITIGWTGSSTTLPYFENILPELSQIKKKFRDKVRFKIIVDEIKSYPSIEAHTTPWSLNNEIQELGGIDIGLMPLPDTEWAKGKCGFKAIQYMSMEIPPIISAVGVNTEIIQDGINGFLITPNNNKEWVTKIEQLIIDSKLREKLGKAGRETVIQKYSIEANKQKYLDIFNTL